MRLELNNAEIQMVVAGLRSNGNPAMYKLSDRIEALSRDLCPNTVDGNHYMVKPSQTSPIQWGEYGMCRNCKVVRRME